MRVRLSTHEHLSVAFPLCVCVRMCVRVCALSNIVTLVYAASVCLQLSHCDRERMNEVEYSDNMKE